MRSTSTQREIDELVARGWTIEEDGPDRIVMVDREFGSVGSHLLVALLTIWWTMGLGNVLWGAYNYVSNSRRRVVWDRTAACPNCGTALGDDVSYCPACGRNVETDASGPEPELACPDCGAVAASGDRYCRVCGTDLADEPSEPTAAS